MGITSNKHYPCNSCISTLCVFGLLAPSASSGVKQFSVHFFTGTKGGTLVGNMFGVSSGLTSSSADLPSGSLTVILLIQAGSYDHTKEAGRTFGVDKKLCCTSML